MTPNELAAHLRERLTEATRAADILVEIIELQKHLRSEADIAVETLRDKIAQVDESTRLQAAAEAMPAVSQEDRIALAAAAGKLDPAAAINVAARRQIERRLAPGIAEKAHEAADLANMADSAVAGVVEGWQQALRRLQQ